jgi:two-component system cell cycle response regulator
MDSIDVLVVDDDHDGRNGLLESIRILGYACRCAQDGAEALEQYASKPADIVLTDWTMPRMDGLELCLKLKTGEATAPPYVILMSAYDGRDRLLRGIRAGADDFLRKPIDFDELEVRLIAAARLVSAHRTLSEKNKALERHSEQSFRVARTDPLTLVANRLRLNEDLESFAANAVRYGHRYSAAICDVDAFKAYNDRYGHLAGDVALQQIAGALRDAVRSGDTVYRYGGEEFVVILPEQTAKDAAHAMERLRAAVEALGISHPEYSSCGVLTVSAGVAELQGGAWEDWLARADAALYEAKSAGRNCVRMAATPALPLTLTRDDAP